MADSLTDGPTLPASTYKANNRPSHVSSLDEDDGLERGFLPMAFDPTPVAGPPTVTRKQVPQPGSFSPAQSENRSPRDYFGSNGKLSARVPAKDGPSDEQRETSTRSPSGELDSDRTAPPQASPHIVYQEKGRSTSYGRRDTPGSGTPGNGSITATPSSPERTQRSKPRTIPADSQALSQEESFKLQEAPKHRKVGSKSDSYSRPPVSPIEPEPKEYGAGKVSPMSPELRQQAFNTHDDTKRKEVPQAAASPVPPSRSSDRTLPLRGDSLAASSATTQPRVTHERHPSTASVPSSFADTKSSLSREAVDSKAPDSPDLRKSFDAVPARAPNRPTAPATSGGADNLTNRAPPTPMAAERHRKEYADLLHNDTPLYPSLQSDGLSRNNSDGAFSMEDEMARILRGERSQNPEGVSPSVLRRVSNAVKHGRSFSERETTRSGKLPTNASMENTSSPLAAPASIITSTITPTTSDQSGETPEQLRASLRRAQAQITELTTEKLALQEKLNSSSEIKAANTELREKRSTMAILDSQREIVARELEVVAEHLNKAKESGQPLDLNTLKSNILKDFAESIQKLKDSMGSQIEELIHKRSELTDEITNLIQMKDKGFREYESLSNKNAQLLQHNNELARGIKDNRAPNGATGANGLGIFHMGAKSEGPGTAEMRNLQPMNTDSSGSNLYQDADVDGTAAVVSTPQVINIRKGGKANKFNWRRGENLAKNVTKGIKGAFAERQPTAKELSIGLPYNYQHHATGAFPGSDQSSLNGKGTEDGRSGSVAGFGFFGQKGAGFKVGGHFKNNSSSNLTASDGSGMCRNPEFRWIPPLTNTVLFGSELSARCEYETRVLPNIVVRCIQEVESRGMDSEGIYRKSGGAGQIKTVQQGLEKDIDYDLSDPDLEIHAVTSTLKQYFRKLPTPLITYDVYDSLLEAGQMQEREKQVVAFKLAIHDLPDAHRDCLQYLVQHLARVIAHESQNLMTPLNLSVVFAPTIMRPLSIEREMTDMQTQRVAVQALLEHHKSIFPSED